MLEASPVFGQRFQLIDRQELEEFFEVEGSTPSVEIELDEFLAEREDDFFSYGQERWNETRKAAEEGRLPSEEIEVSTAPAGAQEVAEAPTLPEPELEVPAYGTSLSITGRKVIGFNYSTKKFLNPQTSITRAGSQSVLDIDQQLQIRMQGKVGPKISVNIDYDDTKPNKQDISVVYQGDPQEVVQNASFGDINLSLPATEFVSYDKQLFGIRADIKVKRLNWTIVGSRTKGTTKSKQFVGTTQFVSRDILDVNYIRRQFYDLTFGNTGRLPIQPGSEQVFIDLQIPSQRNINTQNLTVDDLGEPSATYTGEFNQLIRGQDYVVDYTRGVLNFRNALPAQAVVAVNFLNFNGTSLAQENGTGRFKLIKTSNDLPISTSTASQELGFKRELKTFYSLGQAPIIRDDGRGSFILRVLDQNRNEVGPSLTPIQSYPGSIEVDFERGTFHLLEPFAEADIYNPTPTSHFVLFSEFRFRLKTYFLEPNLVFQSETVLLDGARLTRNVDYYIDYDSGFINFFNEEKIRPNSVIDVSYEVAPFGGLATNSLLGTRVSYNIASWWSAGSTLLYDAATKSPTVPNINELARSLFVYEADTQIKGIKLLPFLSLSNLGVEVAQSQNNPNLSKFAIVDNMEGIKSDDSASTDKNFWFIASNPSLVSADPQAFTVNNESIKVLDISPNSQASPNDTQQVLRVDYNFDVNSSSEVSIVYPFSDAGLDFSQKTFLEVVMFSDRQAADSGAELNFTLGSINEDVIGNGVLRTEDLNNDNILQAAEDIGWLYDPPGKNSTRFGANNGRLDSVDLNHNGRLDAQDFSGGSFGYAGTPGLFDVTSGSTRATADFSDGKWHVFQVPLNISTAAASNWAAIRQVRLSLRKGASSSGSGFVRIARLSVVGNTWRQGTVEGSSGTLQVSGINNEDNPDYVPIFNSPGDGQAVFNDLNSGQRLEPGVKNRVEQALSLTFQDLAPGSTAFTQRQFARAFDISQHKKFRFLVFSRADLNPDQSSGAETFFLRLGNAQNYFQYSFPITSGFNGWKLFSGELVDENGDKVPDSFKNATAGADVTISTVGSPSFQQITSIFIGLINNGGVAISSGSIWVNELHVSEPLIRTGNARKLEASFDVPRWMNFGAKHRFVDRDWQTPTTVVSNQDNRQDSAFLNFSRLGFFPMNFNANRTITETPSVALTGANSNLVSLLQQGRVVHWTGSGTGNLSLGKLPKFNLGYNQDRIEYELLTRLDDKKSYSGQMSYSVPLKFSLFPRTVDLSYTRTLYSVTFESLQVLLTTGTANTEEFTDDLGAKLSYQFKGGSAFNPTYSLKKVKENREEFTLSSVRRLSYPKAVNQTAGFTANLNLLKWLSPSFNYSVNNVENNLLSPSTVVVQGSTSTFDVGDIKTVNRTASGGVSLSLAMNSIFTKSKLLRSMNLSSSYQIQDGDNWENVEKEFSSLTDLWIRKPLSPRNAVARRSSLTLRDTINSTLRWSPLEAYELTGRGESLRTLTLTNNYVLSDELKEVTGTRSRSVAVTLPDILATLSKIEKLLRTEDWMANALINLKFARRTTENVGSSFGVDQNVGMDFRFMGWRRYDTAFSFNQKDTSSEDLRIGKITQEAVHRDMALQTTFDVRHWRFTPKIDYAFDRSVQGNGVVNQDVTVITPSVLGRADLALPRGLRLPFTKKDLVLPNRLIWTSTLSLAFRRSPVTQGDNFRLLNFTSNGDYEIAKNLRMTLSAGLQRLWHKFLKQEDFISYNLGTTVTFQF